MRDLIETNITDYINGLNITQKTKSSLHYWLDRKAEGQACEDFISGMCLALQTENKITPENTLVILLWEPAKPVRKEGSTWVTKLINFLRGIR